ncbi:MAG: hypothetical protein IPL65_00790 [Lewinellaceae bacterium]|nr:hypothetical protein [Lewinellaceae bacterium]
MLSIVDLIDKSRQRYIYASIGVGTLGTLFFFVMQFWQNSTQEPMVAFFGAILIVTAMLGLMTMSGFKAK